MPGREATGQAERDAADLAKFGYKQELKRTLGLFSSFAVAFSYISPSTGIFTLYYWASSRWAGGCSGPGRWSPWASSSWPSTSPRCRATTRSPARCSSGRSITRAEPTPGSRGGSICSPA